MSSQSFAEAQMAHQVTFSRPSDPDLQQPLIGRSDPNVSFSFRGGGGSTLKFS